MELNPWPSEVLHRSWTRRSSSHIFPAPNGWLSWWSFAFSFLTLQQSVWFSGWETDRRIGSYSFFACSCPSMYVRFENMTNSEIIEILMLFLMQYHAHEFEKAAERKIKEINNESYCNCRHILVPPIRQNWSGAVHNEMFSLPTLSFRNGLKGLQALRRMDLTFGENIGRA